MGAILRQNFWPIIPSYHGRAGGVNPLSDHNNVIMREPFLRYYKASTKGTEHMTILQINAFVVTMNWNNDAYSDIINAMELREFLDFLYMEDVLRSVRNFARLATI
jgi:hypothetical protein